MLLLKRHLLDLVRSGAKRQTIRFWSRPMVRAGQLAFTPGLGRVRILSVERLASLRALTARDARADGFPTRRRLLAEIRAIYGPAIPPGRFIYRVRFAWPAEPASDPARASPAPRRQRSAPALRRASSLKKRILRDFLVAAAPRR
jgi:hypothetical protein